MIETISRLLDMPLKNDSESESNVAVKNDEVHENDVLMGRGGKNNRHVGNEKLRGLAREQVEKYKVSTKKIKSAISRELVRKVRRMDPPGRFLRRLDNGEWEDVGDYLAREKVAQVLRDAVCDAAEAEKSTSHAAVVLRQSPPGFEPLPFDDKARRLSVPGVVAASTSSSFGYPPGYQVPYPWHPYSPQHHPAPYSPQHHPAPYSPQREQSYRGMRPPYPPPGYPPIRPAQFIASPTPIRPPYLQSPGAATAQSESANTSTSRRRPSSPGNEPRPPPYGTAYSISLSVASTPVAAAPGTRTEAVMAWSATPEHGRSRRKRSYSLPGERESAERATQQETERLPPEPASTGKRNTATQTPSYETGVATTMVGPPIQIPVVWQQPRPPPMMPYPSNLQSPPGEQLAYYEQHSHQYARIKQSTLYEQTQPPVRSLSEPLPRGNRKSTLNAHDSADSSEHSVLRTRPSIFSSRKIPRRMQEEEGTDSIMEPLPAILLPQSLPQFATTPALPPAQSLPQPATATQPTETDVAGRTGSNSSSRRNSQRGGGSLPDEGGLEWFQGQLLLESDEDISENNEDNPTTPYPI